MLTRYTKLIPAGSGISHAVAAFSVAVGVLARVALNPVLGETGYPYITLFPAVLIASVLAGGRSGLLALGLSALSAWYVFIPPSFSLHRPTPADVLSLALFVLGGGLSILAASSLRGATEHLETARERLMAALEASGTGTWRWNPREDALEWDPALATVFGLTPHQAPTTLSAFLGLIQPEDQEHARRSIKGALGEGSAAQFEFRTMRPDGAVRWIHARSRLIREVDGRPLALVGACLDITERREAEDRQKLLINELNHRVKNTLATVQSLATQTLRSSESPQAFREAFLARLMALSATHNILTQEMWESALVEEVIAAEFGAHGGLDGRRVTARGEPVRLRPQQALSLGMAVHELVTNAVKYGALSVPEGRVAIAWHVAPGPDGTRRLALQWQEENGPPVIEPTRRGFGSKLIERSVHHELGGDLTLAFAPEGLRCEIAMPI